MQGDQVKYSANLMLFMPSLPNFPLGNSVDEAEVKAQKANIFKEISAEVTDKQSRKGNKKLINTDTKYLTSVKNCMMELTRVKVSVKMYHDLTDHESVRTPMDLIKSRENKAPTLRWRAKLFFFLHVW